MSCNACQNNDAIATTSWTKNCPSTSTRDNSAFHSSASSGMTSGGFCLKCSSFWIWVIVAVIAFWIISEPKEKK